MRAMNLANSLVAAGHKVVLWSSAFYHQEKLHRTRINERFVISDRLEIRLIPSSGYKRNIGFDRLFDHWLLGRNLESALRNETTQPDVAFVGYPPIEAARVFGQWLKHKGVPFMLDVKDLWPEVFLEALPMSLRPFGRLGLLSYFRQADRCFELANGISTISESFLERLLGRASRKRRPEDGVFNLTVSVDEVAIDEIAKADLWWSEQYGVCDDETFRVCYIGNLSPNVDLAPIRTAAEHYLRRREPVEFLICGNGISLDRFRGMMAGIENVKFPGRIDRPKIVSLARRSHAALIPYVNIENFEMSLPNKCLDSLSLGFPILSSLKGEVAKLIETNGVGFSYDPLDERSLILAIDKMASNRKLWKAVSIRATDTYARYFSYEKVYGGLVLHLERLAEI